MNFDSRYPRSRTNGVNWKLRGRESPDRPYIVPKFFIDNLIKY